MADEDEIVDEELVEGEEGEEEAPKSRKGLFITIAVLLLAGGAGAFYFLRGGDGAADTAKAEAPRLPPIYVNLDPPFVVNFEADSLVRFLQITISILTRDPVTEELLKKNDPRIRNDLLMLLGNQRYEDISTRDGKEKLQTAALESVRAVVTGAGGKGAEVEALYFTAFVMQ